MLRFVKIDGYMRHNKESKPPTKVLCMPTRTYWYIIVLLVNHVHARSLLLLPSHMVHVQGHASSDSACYRSAHVVHFVLAYANL